MSTDANWGFSLKSNRMPNCVDLEETTCYEPSHLDMQCLHKYLFWSAGMKRFLTQFSLETPIWVIGKQCRPRSDPEKKQHLIRVYIKQEYL